MTKLFKQTTALLLLTLLMGLLFGCGNTRKIVVTNDKDSLGPIYVSISADIGAEIEPGKRHTFTVDSHQFQITNLTVSQDGEVLGQKMFELTKDVTIKITVSESKEVVIDIDN